MTKKWTITQNIIATLLQAWALYFLYSFTEHILAHVSLGTKVGAIKSTDVNYFTLFSIYHITYLSGLLALYGGIALLYDKKGGWVASAASSLVFMGFFLVSGRNGITAADDAKGGGYSYTYLLAGLAFAAVFVMLVLKPIREKYRPTFANWLVIGAIAAAVIVDRQLWGH